MEALRAIAARVKNKQEMPPLAIPGRRLMKEGELMKKGGGWLGHRVGALALCILMVPPWCGRTCCAHHMAATHTHTQEPRVCSSPQSPGMPSCST